MEFEGMFWLNEQDPYEPTGIMFLNKNGNIIDLSDVLIERFGLKKTYKQIPQKTLKITIEEA